METKEDAEFKKYFIMKRLRGYAKEIETLEHKLKSAKKRLNSAEEEFLSYDPDEEYAKADEAFTMQKVFQKMVNDTNAKIRWILEAVAYLDAEEKIGAWIETSELPYVEKLENKNRAPLLDSLQEMKASEILLLLSKAKNSSIKVADSKDSITDFVESDAFSQSDHKYFLLSKELINQGYNCFTYIKMVDDNYRKLYDAVAKDDPGLQKEAELLMKKARKH